MTTPPPPQDDPIDVVMHQTGCTRDEAEQAMALHPGDVVSAIMFATPPLGPIGAHVAWPSGPVAWMGRTPVVSDMWKEAGQQARDMHEAIEAHVKKNKCTYYQSGEALSLADQMLWQLAIRDLIEDLWRDMRDAKASVERNTEKHGQ